MKLSGWIFMASAWLFIIGQVVFCFSRIFKKGLDSEDTSRTTSRINK